MEKRRKNAEILDRSIAFFYDMIYQINMAIQEQDLNRKSFKFENHFYNRRKLLWKQQSSKPPARSVQVSAWVSALSAPHLVRATPLAKRWKAWPASPKWPTPCVPT